MTASIQSFSVSMFLSPPKKGDGRAALLMVDGGSLRAYGADGRGGNWKRAFGSGDVPPVPSRYIRFLQSVISVIEVL